MSLLSKTADKIAELLVTTIKGRLRKYKPETMCMPFHCKFLGEDKYAMFSFVQSMDTTFGVSIWECIVRGQVLIFENL